MIDRQIEFLKSRSQLELGGSDLVMASFGWNTKSPKLLFNLSHEINDAWSDGAEIMVVELLMTRGRRAKEGAACLNQIRTLKIERFVDEEIFLLRPQRHGNMRGRFIKTGHKT